ncbi:MAG: nodulation protein NfeD [Desulfobulbaceae bacterium]|jgi:membrane-bound serine protease (ClpP class)|nr:nodulation protein NfeD [Desulfobulbaceae bacterium]MDY0351658.1 nodulation protein NfeD [Desulfobulbaceae bacterium]
MQVRQRRCRITLLNCDKTSGLRRRPIFLLLFWLTVLAAGAWSAFSAAGGEPRTVVVLSIKGPIGPAISDYVVRGLHKAEEAGAAAVILQMDTPGGFDHSMREIISHILASPVPVISYVAPGGSRAASAGTYILYASHVAAMAPTTNLGAATPIKVGGLPGMPDKEPESADKKEEDKDKFLPKDALERKMINDAVAYITALARRHGRNAEWAERAVREAVSLNAGEALELGVIDLVAANLEELLEKVDGREVVMEEGRITLATAGVETERYEPDWRTRLLAVITDPNVAYILMLLGVYGLIYELANPGFILPGMVGLICLLLALYTFQILPINYAGLALIILGMLFMIGEAVTPSFGALGVGGVIAFVVGSIILMDEESMRISLPLIFSIALLSATFFMWVIGRMYAISRKKVRTGSEEMIGSIGEAMSDFAREGRIWVHGESWRAVSSAPVAKGEKVQVVSQDGLTLNVKKMQEDMP